MNDLEKNSGSPDRIETLLRATGRRPAVPADTRERVHQAVRAEWRAEVDRRSRHRRVRWTGLLAAAAIVAALVLSVGLVPWRADPVLRVEKVAGGSSSNLAAGDRIEAGTELSTGDDGRLALRAATGHSIRLDTNTRLTVLSKGVLALDRGAVYVDSESATGAAPSGIELRTPFGTLRDRGTQFETRLLPASLLVRVREGVVVLDHPRGRRQVTAGFELKVTGDGRVSRRRLPAFGQPWSWIETVTPMLEIEGRSLREFLDWLARERGLRLEMADPGLAVAADEIVLSGSIRGMTLDQALDSVLPTCGMTRRAEGGTLRVEASAAD